MANEKYLQVPFDEGYMERLTRRADENDRVVSREASRIVKDVLDDPLCEGAAGHGGGVIGR